ncbi:MAG TPA: hypothetical protein PKA88_13395 [Polyangiaceae bacterium]|nr:hypothetical protein [Polyangiaceae bacterium]
MMAADEPGAIRRDTASNAARVRRCTPFQIGCDMAARIAGSSLAAMSVALS